MTEAQSEVQSEALSEVLSVEQMYAADRAAMAAGISGEVLMEAAGEGVARAILQRFGVQPTAILCGPGNNGGDGFVIARHLRKAGAKVRLALLGDKANLKGDAATMAKRWRGRVYPLDVEVLDGAALVVDGIFGAGLARAVSGPARAVLEAAELRSLAIVAVDTPSGVQGDGGQVLGYAPRAAMTVTFFRPKSGHLLYPGRGHCGELRVVDIGIPAAVLAEIRPSVRLNGPDIWLPSWPPLQAEGHKYSRGHAVVLSGPAGKTGAGRLAAGAALRIGAGLVTVASPKGAVAENAAHLTAVMIDPWRDSAEFRRLLSDPRRNAVCLGPGAGVGKQVRDHVLAALALKKAVVLDADAITAFAKARKGLFRKLHENCILTPHHGEFSRLFDGDGDKLQRTRRAATACGAVVLFKGPDTVIAAPDGRAVINTNAPPSLATAGSGDVLAGFCVGLLAQGVPAFEAAAAACWLHGAAAERFGPGLTAEELAPTLPAVLAALQNKYD
ncbi:MAG: NAD(P)H-hydrate dehydratase [Alphaproteobacteria bacterium]|jgi:NAD(P)H-hydrate epimerase|nr:NAD(P)H-hydrate dehydratase [Alphaproteobacteria bacterium]